MMRVELGHNGGFEFLHRNTIEKNLLFKNQVVPCLEASSRSVDSSLFIRASCFPGEWGHGEEGGLIFTKETIDFCQTL